MDYDFYLKAIEKLFYVKDKDGQTMPFKLNGAQLRLLKELSGSDIILKSRQQGISTFLLAILTVVFLTQDNQKCVVIAHEAGVTTRLFDRVKGFLESLSHTFPGKGFALKYNSRRELMNTQNGSTFYIGTAGQRAFGHGDTINWLHISEFSRYPEPERLLSGLLQAVPKDGHIFMETTANGYNYFYRIWEKNRITQDPFRTHFIPWFESIEYALPVPLHTEFETEELDYMNKYHLSRDQMMWRRWKIGQLNGDLDAFNESYPATPHDAFIVSGNNVWSNTLLGQYMLQTKDPQLRGSLVGFNPIDIMQNEKGHLRIWVRPEEFHSYVIGVDVSEGKIVAEGDEESETDYSCAQVIDRTTYEQVAVWHGKVDPDILGRQVELLGRYYNNALIAVERNSVGLTPLIVLRDLYYPNLYYRETYGQLADRRTPELGWVTDMNTKDLIINEATQLIRDKRLAIRDSDTIGEMMSFVRDARGRASASSGAHDDRVMAFLIAVKMLSQPMQTMKGNPIEKGSETEAGMFWMNGVPFNSNGMPVDPDQPYVDGGVEF
jgi:hypothetical protein